ncbi:MAG: hypothetical protein L0H81_05595, partial [Actinomyces sp.]|nr:hypothetical protein [Actinomyces sp.]
MVMASGTLVSRILGFLRNFLLLAAIGTGAGSVSAAFGVANNLPNTVYNLLAAGVFDAVLVPQIVRALRSRSGNVYVNRLITLAGTILFGVTLIAMVAAPLLVTLFAKGYSGELRSLSIAFTLLCLPQIFFYGIYNLLGELLNARGIFGPYMWAPVVNNVVGITGLVAFLVMWGPAPGDGVFPVGDFSSPQFWLLAGSATLGVLLQALVLLIPMRNAGVSLRLDFHFRGTSFGTASKVAGWTFATLGVSQIGILSTSNLATQVDTWAAGKDVLLAGIASYTTAFMIYMVPQSLISVSLATAIFTRLANAAAERDGQTMADNYHQGVRLITLLSLLAAAVLMAGAVPMMQLALPPGASPEAARAYSWVLLALMPGVASTGMVLMSQRVFFALEDARPVFLMGIAPTLVQVAVGWSIFALAGPEWWTAGAALGETVCRLLQGFIAVFWVAREIREVNPGRIIASYLKFLAAAVVSFLVGLGVISLLGPVSDPASRLVRYLMAGGKLLVVAILVTAVYVLVLRLIDPSDAGRVLPDLARRLPLPAALRRAVAGRPTGGDWDNGLTQDGRATEGAMERDQDGTDHDGQQEAVGNSDSPLVPGSRPETSPAPPDTGHAADADAGSQDADARTWSAMGTAWSASDPTNTGEFPVISRLTAGRVTPAGRADLPSFDEILRPRGSEASDEGDAGASPEHEGAGDRHMLGGTPDVDPDNQHLTDSLPGDGVGIDESPEGRDRGEDAPLPHLPTDLGPSVAPDPEGTMPGDAPTSPGTGSEAASAHWIADLGAEEVEEAEGTRPATGASSPGPDSLPAPPPPGTPFDPASFPTTPAGIDAGGPQLLPGTDEGDLASPPHPGTGGDSSPSIVDAAQTSGANPESAQGTHPHWLHPDAPEDG